MQRRDLCIAGALALTTPSWAQPAAELPKTPIKLVVGFSAGGGTDVIARILAQKLQALWGSTVIVENKAGASGTLAADYVAKQPADGSTLLLAHISSNAIAPGLYPKLGYAPDRDFSPIAMLGQTPMVLMFTPAQPARTLGEIVELCHKNPGRVTFGSAGIGSAQHLALEAFKVRARIDVLHVPYKGTAPLVNDMLGGQVQYAFEGMTSASTYIKTGRMMAAAQTRAKRSRTMPELPTIAELGYPGFDASIWFALAGPANMAPALVARMNADVNQTLQAPDVAARLAEFGAEDGGGTPQALATFMRAERARWAKVIHDAKVTLDS